MPKRVYICCDKDSWVNDFLNDDQSQSLLNFDFEFQIIHNHVNVSSDFICFLVGYSQVVPINKGTADNFYVVHESNLPAGRGWSPVSWQVLDGAREIIVSLIKAAKNIDSGNIMLQDKMILLGHELVEEIRLEQMTVTFRIISKFLELVSNGEVLERPQRGVASYYSRRTNSSSEVDTTKSIEEVFDLLRIVDNERYPAFFYLRGHKYILKIVKG